MHVSSKSVMYLSILSLIGICFIITPMPAVMAAGLQPGLRTTAGTFPVVQQSPIGTPYGVCHGELDETSKHGENSTVMPAATSYLPSFSPDMPKHWLFTSKGDYVHDRPVFYGVSGELTLAFMFKDKERVWFAHSPSGGGPGCPAWDFFAIFPSPRVDETCKVTGRLVATPFRSPSAILAEHEAFENGT